MLFHCCYIFDELEHIVNIQSLLKLNLVFFLNFAYNAYQIKEGILDLDSARIDLSIEILV